MENNEIMPETAEKSTEWLNEIWENAQALTVMPYDGPNDCQQYLEVDKVIDIVRKKAQKVAELEAEVERIRKLAADNSFKVLKDLQDQNEELCTSTFLSDSNGKMIHIGDLVRYTNDFNVEVHGNWSAYEVSLVGIIPVLFYRYSEKGKILPEGYTGQPLSEFYDTKMLLFHSDISSLKPTEQLEVISTIDSMD